MKKTTPLLWFNTSIIGEASLFWLIKTSIMLDLRFWRRNRWVPAIKCEFLAKKYFLLFLHMLKLRSFQLAHSAMKFRGKQLFYESSLGFSNYQSILTRHEFLLSQCQLQDDGTFVDVGANVGYFTLLLAEKFPHARIVAFEPVQKVFLCLQKNTTDLSNVEVINMALADFEGRAFMQVDEYNSQTSQLTDVQTGEEVVVSTLDTIARTRNISEINLLKIDVENLEKCVLQGASATLAHTQYLLIEISMVDNDRYTFSDVVSLLHSDRYNFQLRALRNFHNVAEGLIPVGDFLFENILDHSCEGQAVGPSSSRSQY